MSGMVAVTAVMPSSHVTVGGPRKFTRNQALVTHEESARRAHRRTSGEKKRNGLAIRMRDVPAKVSFQLGWDLEDLSEERFSHSAKTLCRRRSHLIARLIAPATVHVATGRAPPPR